jgi:hypothetical protein
VQRSAVLWASRTLFKRIGRCGALEGWILRSRV